jgi:hypothetical protein
MENYILRLNECGRLLQAVKRKKTREKKIYILGRDGNQTWVIQSCSQVQYQSSWSLPWTHFDVSDIKTDVNYLKIELVPPIFCRFYQKWKD